MTTIIKQVIINRLPVPIELADVIKEFCFQSIRVMINRQKTRHACVQLQFAATTIEYLPPSPCMYHELAVRYFDCPATADQVIRICGHCGNYVTNLIPRSKEPCYWRDKCVIYVHIEKIKCICTRNVMRGPCGKLPRGAELSPVFYERKAHAGFDYSGPHCYSGPHYYS
jgi:hypothetical protein